MEISTIDEQLVRGGQAVYLTLIEEWSCVGGAHKSVTIEIKSDAHKAQSHARIKVWSQGEWKLLFAIIPYCMATPEGLYAGRSGDFLKYEREECRVLFEEDVLRLREVGKKILSGKDTK
jgi:hypothetical protein